MQSQANIKYQRISPKKIKYIARAASGQAAEKAAEKLFLMGNKSARILSKAIKSALANLKNKGVTDVSSVKIKHIIIGKGPFLKRWNPVSRGMAHKIKKRTSHIKVLLEEQKFQDKGTSQKNPDISKEKNLESKKIMTKDNKERSKSGT